MERYRGTSKFKDAEWIMDALAPQLKVLRSELLRQGSDWLRLASQLTVQGFWEKIAASKIAGSITVVLFFRMVCRVRDGSAAAVEQFISIVNLILANTQRRHISEVHLEDMCRIMQNGCAFKDLKTFRSVVSVEDRPTHQLCDRGL
jgi:hypothetical protein